MSSAPEYNLPDGCPTSGPSGANETPGPGPTGGPPLDSEAPTIDSLAQQLNEVINNALTFQPLAAWVNRELDGYRLLYAVGETDQSVVFRGIQICIPRDIAIKIVRDSGARSGATSALVEEARRTARFNHPNIVQVHDFRLDERENAVWMIMEWLEGMTVAERLERDLLAGNTTGIPWAEAFRITIEVLEALSVIHAPPRITHMDIKPSNIFLIDKGGVKLIDLGLAVFSHSVQGNPERGIGRGTPQYASPEHFGTGVIDHRSDLYSLGATLYHMLTGERPFREATSLPQLIHVQRTDPAPDPRRLKPSLPGVCTRIVGKAMALDPDDRYQDAATMRHALREALTHDAPTPARPIRGMFLLGVPMLAACLFVLFHLWRQSSGPLPVPEFKGHMDMYLAKRNGQELRPTWPLARDGTLPLRKDDCVQIRAKLSNGPPAYVYLLWIDSVKEATTRFPVDWQWNRLPTSEVLGRDLVYPMAGLQEGCTRLAASPSGVEVLLLLVRTRPLTLAESTALRELLHRMKWKQPDALPRAAVYLQDGADAATYGAGGAVEALDNDDPISQLGQLMRKLRADQLADFTMAVCYPFAAP